MNNLEQTITRYLLGELSEREQAALEKSFFTDPQVSDQLSKTENELVDGYVRNQLSSEVRERFEQSYMAHPARRQRVKFARALTTRLDGGEAPVIAGEQTPSPVSRWQGLLRSLLLQRPMLSFSIVLATLLIMLGGVWIFVESRRRQQQREIAQIQAARENQERRARDEQTQRSTDAREGKDEVTGEEKPTERGSPKPSPQPSPQPSPSPTPSSTAPSVVVLALNVGGVRRVEGSRVQTLVIPQGTTQARLLLNLENNSYPGYRVSLQKIGGEDIFTQTNVKPRSTKSGASFVFTVPTRQLTSGDYALTLSGISPEGEVDDLTKSLIRVVKR